MCSDAGQIGDEDPRRIAVLTQSPVRDDYRRVHGSREHRVIWEGEHGSIPIGHVIHHIDGNKRNNAIDNLACISNSEHMKLHCRQRREAPPEIKAAHLANLTRKTAERGRKATERESLAILLRRAYGQQ
jgi:hypothetical protein